MVVLYFQDLFNEITILVLRNVVIFSDILLIHPYIIRLDWIFSWSSSVTNFAKITDSALCHSSMCDHISVLEC